MILPHQLGPITHRRPNHLSTREIASSSVPTMWLPSHHLSPPALPAPRSLLHTTPSSAASPRFHSSPHSQTLALRPAMSIAAAAASLVASSSLSVPDHLRLRRPPPPLRFRRRSKNRLVLAILEEQSSSALTEEEARKFGLNGSASRLGYDDAAVEAYLGSNGNGNGNSNRSASGSGNGASVKPVASGSGTSVVSGRGPGEDERRRKERVEEIGREDAWFKRSDGEAMPKVNICLLYLFARHFLFLSMRLSVCGISGL